ncbi:MAG TPA: hypothetical protein VE870_02690, partial [Bacteroidales bacterium]|nr:hypothetical protein [Bacteroidales bacterium]
KIIPYNNARISENVEDRIYGNAGVRLLGPWDHPEQLPAASRETSLSAETKEGCDMRRGTQTASRVACAPAGAQAHPINEAAHPYSATPRSAEREDPPYATTVIHRVLCSPHEAGLQDTSHLLSF